MTDISPDARDWAGLVILSTDECYERLRHAPVARLGFVDAGDVVVLPVNITVDGRSIVFRTGHGSKMSSAAMQSPVCVEIDGWDDLAHTGWSVLARGFAELVLDDESIDRFETLPVRPWASPELRNQWVRVVVEEISGRRIVNTPGR
jgi:nitroimidazol reductase NimA-like FMN-containing flavoprotein (pyridoxamine 5'-phosphate oxidase superfamily)